MERNIIREGKYQIIEETNTINKITFFQLRDGDDLLATAEISTAGDVWLFNRIFSSAENRAKGYGSEVLKKVIEYINRKNIDLFAYIYSTGSLSEIQLDAWYRRYGFVDASEEGYQLVRYSRQP